MNKKAQLMGIELKFFFVGLLIGIILAITLLVLSAQDILPFAIPWVCG
jgi:ABC-type phosphate/phosphonate transport system permease subunit